MKDSLRTEFQTILTNRKIWILSFIFLTVCVWTFSGNYNAVESYLQYYGESVEYYQGLLAEAEVEAEYRESIEENLTQLAQEADEMLVTYMPQMFWSHACGVFNGLGLFFMIAVAAIFAGEDYGKSQMIRLKAARYGYRRVFFSKLVVFAGYLAGVFLLALAVQGAAAIIKWNALQPLMNELLPGERNLEMPFGAAEHILSLLVTYLAVLLFSLAGMLLSIAFKNEAIGLLLILPVNLLRIDISFSPANVVSQLLNRFVYTSDFSNIYFSVCRKPPLSTGQAAAVFAAYFIAVLAGVYAVAKKQRL